MTTTMKASRKLFSAFALATALAATLGACAAPDIASRNMAAGALDLAATPPQAAGGDVLVTQYKVREIRVTVPDTLSASEANLFYPVADIVWRGDPRGNRHAQVGAIFEEAFAKAAEPMSRGPEVVVDVAVRRFHSVSEKTRYAFGGVASIRYDLTVRDAASGAVLDGPRRVAQDIRISGGRKAIEEEMQGLTERVVLVHNLAHGALRELSTRASVAPEVPLTRIDSDLPLTLAAVSTKGAMGSESRAIIAAHAR